MKMIFNLCSKTSQNGYKEETIAWWEQFSGAYVTYYCTCISISYLLYDRTQPQRRMCPKLCNFGISQINEFSFLTGTPDPFFMSYRCCSHYREKVYVIQNTKTKSIARYGVVEVAGVCGKNGDFGGSRRVACCGVFASDSLLLLRRRLLDSSHK